MQSGTAICAPGTEQHDYAKILGILGDPTGVPALIAAVDAHERWDQGMALTSQRKTGNMFSDLDRLVIALGFSRAPEALAPLLRKLGQLEPDSELSHYKAISLALWDCLPRRSRTAGKSLDQPGFTGHATPEPVARSRNPAARIRLGSGPPGHHRWRRTANRTNLNKAYRELIVAAMLYRCGDKDGMAEAILRLYAKDLHGHFASYAQERWTAVVLECGDLSPLWLSFAFLPHNTFR